VATRGDTSHQSIGLFARLSHAAAVHGAIVFKIPLQSLT